MSFAEDVDTIVFETFHADGFDPVKKTLDGTSEAYNSPEGKAFISDPLTVATSFMGLPNRRLNPTEKQSWNNVGKNFIGWRADRSLAGMLFLMPLITLFNIISTPFKFLLNILKVYTEVLPSIAIKGIGMIAGIILSPSLERIKVRGMFSIGPYYIPNLFIAIPAFALTASFTLAFIIVQVYGAALTSPINNIRQNWLSGNIIGKQFTEGLGGKYAGIVLGTLMASLAIMNSVMLYTICFPLVAKLFALAVLPHLSATMLGLLHSLSTVFSPVLTAIGKVSLSMANGLASVLGLSPIIATLPEFAALGMLTALALVVTASVVDFFERLMWVCFSPQQELKITKEPTFYLGNGEMDSSQTMTSSFGVVKSDQFDDKIGTSQGDRHAKLYQPAPTSDMDIRSQPIPEYLAVTGSPVAS